MTLKELKEKNPDIIQKEIAPAELDALACGAALFYASLSGTRRPKEDRTVLWAGQVLTAGTFDSDRQVMFLRTTKGGYATLDSVLISELDAGGQAAMFHTAPMGKDDPRSRVPWTEWD